MPFQSKAQARYMFAKHPEIAKEFAEKTNFEDLPDRKGKLKAMKTKGETNGR